MLTTELFRNFANVVSVIPCEQAPESKEFHARVVLQDGREFWVGAYINSDFCDALCFYINDKDGRGMESFDSNDVIKYFKGL